jgi:type I restriction enzyme S subunit
MVPEGWESVRLAELAHVVSERNLDDNNIPVLSMTKYDGFVDSLEYFKKQVFSKDTASYKVVRRGQFAYATIHLDEGSIDLLDKYDAGLISPMYTVFEPNQNRVDLQFLRLLLKSERMISRYGHLGQGSINRRKSIGFKVLGTLDFSLPPLPEQKKIAAILGSVDEAIQATQAVIDQTRKVKQCLLKQLLTRGIGHTRFKQTEIGEIPEGWEVVNIKDLATVKGGKRMPKGRPFAENRTPYPYIRVVDFHEGSVTMDNLKYVLPEDREKIKRYTISSEDLYISIAGSIGLVGTVPACLDGAQLTENAAKICLKAKDKLEKDYLRLVLDSEIGQKQIAVAKGVGGGVPKLALFRIEALQIPVPHPEEQRNIVETVFSIETTLVDNAEQLGALQKLKRGLMQDLLTGHVRVGEVEGVKAAV